jgi:uncharacterized protein YndB with AHSA1/START domain
VKTIHHVVDTDAAPERVWAAVTQPELLAGWWSTELESPPPAVGAQIRFTFGGDFNPVMQITKLDEGRQVDWRCVSGHDPWNDNTFSFQLSVLDDGRTRLRFWQHYAVELEDDYFGTYNFNWGYYLESLRLLCTTGTGKPYRSEPAA